MTTDEKWGLGIAAGVGLLLWLGERRKAQATAPSVPAGVPFNQATAGAPPTGYYTAPSPGTSPTSTSAYGNYTIPTYPPGQTITPGGGYLSTSSTGGTITVSTSPTSGTITVSTPPTTSGVSVSTLQATLTADQQTLASLQQQISQAMTTLGQLQAQYQANQQTIAHLQAELGVGGVVPENPVSG